MSLQRPSPTRFWPAALRWSIAALVIGGAHGAAGWIVANWQRAEAAAGVPPAAVMIELAPLAVAPETPQQEIAPGPQMAESEPEPPSPDPEPVEPPKEIEPPRIEAPEPVPVPEIKIPELPSRPDAEAVLSPPPPPKEVKPKPPPKPRIVQRRKPVNPDKPRSEQNSAPTAQARVAERAAAPAAGAAAPSPAANASWRGSLIAHLNRFKRFPNGASPGTVQVTFTIDRAGRVMSARLVRGSGEPSLDEEAVAMIRRASPVPAPPDGMGGGTVSLAVPIRFSR